MTVDAAAMSTTLRYAGFWRRVGASLLDSIFFVVVFTLIMGPVFANALVYEPAGILRTLLSLVLTVGLWLTVLGTPGKLLLDCAVVDATSLKPMGLRQAILRYVAYLASLLPLMLGFLWVARDPRKQGFHDKIANTVVLINSGADAIEIDDESRKDLQQLMGELR
ncbi:MAG: RDD family protein [Gammaproteobacteria bacterium]|nr:RDD family protein [Gammaproteobacteria bacterium]